jgi:hypothetical protein
MVTKEINGPTGGKLKRCIQQAFTATAVLLGLQNIHAPTFVTLLVNFDPFPVLSRSAHMQETGAAYSLGRG